MDPKNEKNIVFQIVYKFVIAEFSEKVKFKSLASNAKKGLSIYFSFFVTPNEVNVLSSLIRVIYSLKFFFLKIISPIMKE